MDQAIGCGLGLGNCLCHGLLPVSIARRPLYLGCVSALSRAAHVAEAYHVSAVWLAEWLDPLQDH